MNTDSTIRDTTYSFFLMEAPELLQTIESDLLNFREDHSKAKVHNLMRLTHTLKGAAASVGLETIKKVAHSLEDVFKSLYNPEIVVDLELETLLFQGYECLRLPLTAELSDVPINEAQLLDRAAAVFTRLQGKLGDFFEQEAQIPSSAELGFDITKSIFETGVQQRLDALATALTHPESEQLIALLQEQASVFIGLAESLGLPGFAAIAELTILALEAHPDQAITIAQIALADFQQGQAAVIGGDRVRGGKPSVTLEQLAASSERQPQSVELAPIWEAMAELVSPDKIESQLELMTAPVTVNQMEPQLESTELAPIWESMTELAALDQMEPQLESIELTPIWEPMTELAALDQMEPQLESIELAPIWESMTELAALDQMELQPDSEDLVLSLNQLFGGFNPDSQPLLDVGDSEVALIPTALTNQLEVPDSEPILTSVSTITQEMRVTAHTNNAEPILTPVSRSRDIQTQNVRVDLDKLHRLNYLSGELLTNQNRQVAADEQLQQMAQQLQEQLQQHQQILRQMRDQSDRMLTRTRSAVAPRPDSLWSRFDTLELDPYSEFHVLLQSALEDIVQLEETTEAISLFTQKSTLTLEKQQRLLTNVRDDLMTVQMMPLGAIFNRFRPLLEQLVAVYGKSVTLELVGSEVLVEKAIAEKLYDPILHLIRNAFDHGIESPELRSGHSKPETGVIRLSAQQQGRWTTIAVSDDGNGINFEKIYHRAVEMNLLSLDNSVTETTLLDLLFEPGFSTASQLSELSGRGVGLDVVRTQLEALHGSVTVQSQALQGTTFLLQIPFIPNVAKVLVCQAKDQVYTFLADTIEQIVLPSPDKIKHWQGQTVFHWQQGEVEQMVPWWKLSELMPYTNPVADAVAPRGLTAPILLIRQAFDANAQPNNEQLLGLEVDQVIGEQELVIRPVGGMMMPPAYVEGCCILADGHLSLMIDINSLLKVKPTAQVPVKTITAVLQPTLTQVLVVDDSITLRQNISLVLQKAGYQTIQARDGEEAISQIQQHPTVKLIVCDIEMPGMNGFEFLSHRSQSAKLSSIPVVMLTSRNTEKHRQIALELGANSYLTKPYLDWELLSTVAKLIEVG